MSQPCQIRGRHVLIATGCATAVLAVYLLFSTGWSPVPGNLSSSAYSALSPISFPDQMEHSWNAVQYQSWRSHLDKLIVNKTVANALARHKDNVYSFFRPTYQCDLNRFLRSDRA